MSSSLQLFLVVPLEAEPEQIPENAKIVYADSVETLTRAQAIKDGISNYLKGRRTKIGDLKRLVNLVTE